MKLQLVYTLFISFTNEPITKLVNVSPAIKAYLEHTSQFQHNIIEQDRIEYTKDNPKGLRTRVIEQVMLIFTQEQQDIVDDEINNIKEFLLDKNLTDENDCPF